MQRSTNASSTSEISSKSWLAMASLLRGHNLSAGCSSGEPAGRNSEGVSFREPPPRRRYASRPALPPRGCLCPFQLLPPWQIPSESHREQLFVDGGQDQPVDLSGCGSYKALKVGPLLSPLESLELWASDLPVPIPYASPALSLA